MLNNPNSKPLIHKILVLQQTKEQYKHKMFNLKFNSLIIKVIKINNNKNKIHHISKHYTIAM